MKLARLALALYSLALAAAVSAQEAPPAITISYLNHVNAQLVAKALGLHEKELGVPVKWVKFGSGGDVNRAITADQLDFGGVGNRPPRPGGAAGGPAPPPASIGVTRDLPYEGIFVLNMLGAVEGLAGRKSKGV